jgi:transcription initiation factor IIE alpha subunit
MTVERAMEILDPTHREHYDSIDVVNEACRMGMKALEKQMPKKLKVDNEGWYCCPNCNETFKLFNQFQKRNKCCGECGQAIDWSDYLADKRRDA